MKEFIPEGFIIRDYGEEYVWLNREVGDVTNFWFAEKEGSNFVWFGDNTRLFRFNRAEGIVSTMTVKDGIPMVKRYRKVAHNIKEKENEAMASNVNVDSIFDDLNGEVATPSGTQQMSSFDDTLEQIPTKEGSKGRGKKDEKEELIREIQEASSDVTMANIANITQFNRKHGRLLFFITGTDAAPKIKLKKSGVKAADGKRLEPTDEAKADPEFMAAYEDPEKYSSLPRNKFLSRHSIVFEESKPAPVKGAVVKGPVAGEADLSLYFTKNTLTVGKNADPNDQKVRILSKEEFITYVNAYYNGEITEADTYLGDRADVIKVVMEPYKESSTDKGGKEVTLMRGKIIVDPDSAKKRKNLCIRGNYVPMKLYKEVSTVNMSEEDAKLANVSFASLFRDANKYNELVEEDKRNVTRAEDGTCTSVFFAPGQSCTATMRSFDTKEEIVISAIPIKVEKLSKDKGNKMFRYDYLELEDEGGPLSKKEFADLVAMTGMGNEAFIEEIKTHMVTKRSKKKKTELKPSDYLRWLNRDSGDLPEEFTNLAKIFN